MCSFGSPKKSRHRKDIKMIDIVKAPRKSNIVVHKESNKATQDEPKKYKRESGWTEYVYHTSAIMSEGELLTIIQLLKESRLLDHPETKKPKVFLPLYCTIYKNRLTLQCTGIKAKVKEESIKIPFTLDETLDHEAEEVSIFECDIKDDFTKTKERKIIAINQVNMTYTELEPE
jgi:hypothetical protein